MEITVASPHLELLYLGHTVKVQSVNICLLFHPLTMLHEDSIRMHLKSRFRTYGKQMNTPIFSWHIDLCGKSCIPKHPPIIPTPKHISSQSETEIQLF